MLQQTFEQLGWFILDRNKDLNTGRNKEVVLEHKQQEYFLVVREGNFYKANVESWNGTAWTEVNDLNTGRTWTGGGGTKLQQFIGWKTGPPTPTANAEKWDGTSWTEVG